MTPSGAAACLLAFVLGLAAVALLGRVAQRLPQDAPNDRSLHIRPVPRAGGYAIWAGFVPAALWFPPDVPGGALAWWPPWLAIAAISATDDARGVSARVRFVVHLAASLWCAALMWRAISPSAAFASAEGLVAVALIALVLAWSANLYNFMDGNDGLAAAMTFVAFSAYGVGSLSRGDLAVPSFAIAAATLPFLVVNRPRATMFLGDVGAVPLGFIAATFGIAGVADGRWPLWFPVLVFLPFIADATATLARRIVRGDRLGESHRDHYYQRLHRLGAGHGGTLTVYVALMAATAGSATACLLFAPSLGPFAVGTAVVVCFILFAAIDYHWRRKRSP